MRPNTSQLGALLLAFLMAALGSPASAAVIVGYDFNAPSDTPTTVAPDVSAYSLTLGSGTTSPTPFGSGGRLAQSMNSGSQDLNDYFSIAFQPNAGYILDLTALGFDFRKTHDNAPAQWALRYSVNGFASNLASGTQTLSLQNASIPLTDTGLTGLIEFRIYGWAAAASNRNMLIDNVTVSGAVLPEPAALALLAIGGLVMPPRRRPV